jgi:hypothetical protein
MTEPCGANPEDYPHTMIWEGDHVFLVSKLDGNVTLRDLGKGSAIKDGYRRWKHLLDDHSRSEANIFMWGLVTGMGVALWEEIDAIVKGRK